ncbi:hypothetical protein CC86DRAFT_373934 [Ophiobolus disseminans]|uniref:Uncharacterized protein n=1 Tax=Ophiobolus disseminans TaxID=1469910 RepID=A0A6A6ZLC6_9PLEO|nr:hypothetical protein CC86DRAFT_373934 [Ophiobolus disseminans]
MGQGLSQQRSATPEPELSPEERALAQADMRAKQQAALDKRFATQQKKSTATAGVGTQATTTSKKPTALEQMSKDNVSYRNMDAQVEWQRWD